MNKERTKEIVMLGLLVAFHVILSRWLSINAWNIKIGFAFLAVYIGAYFYGPIGGAVVGGLGDILGALLFPIGAYFPGFTLNCALTGVIFGLLLGKKQTNLKIGVAVILNELGISLWITPLWLSILYGSPYWPLIVSRLPQIIIMLIVEVVTIYFMGKVLGRISKNISE